MRESKRRSGFRMKSNRARRALKKSRVLESKRLQIEPLEERHLLTGGPSLAGISTNDGSLLQAGSTLQSAPSELTFVFSPGQEIATDSLSGIQIVRSGFDGVFGNDDDVVVGVGFAGIGAASNEVVVRFAESLPDDLSLIHI